MTEKIAALVKILQCQYANKIAVTGSQCFLTRNRDLTRCSVKNAEPISWLLSTIMG
jgi:hypothetical protein